MTYIYPLAAKVLSEFVGTTLTILFGESIIANELLASTKGHGMGFLAVAIGFGLAFGVNIAWFATISAHLNPAMFFFLALIGKVEWKEFLACSCANFAGAFVGAVLVAIFFMPHFGFSIPLPSNTSDTATYIEGPVSMETNAGRLASAFGPASRKRESVTIGTEIRSFFHLPNDEQFLQFLQGHNTNTQVVPEDVSRLEKMKMRQSRRQSVTLQTAPPTHLEFFNHHSVNLAELARARELTEDCTIEPLRHSVQVAGLLRAHDANNNDMQPKEEDIEAGSTHTAQTDESFQVGVPAQTKVRFNSEVGMPAQTKVRFNGEIEDIMDVETPSMTEDPSNNDMAAAEEQEDPAMMAYKAALQADASAKLSIFATRPAIYNRPWNFLQEAIATMVLVLGAEMFNLRKEFHTELSGATWQDGSFFQSLYVALYITLLVLGLGGTTGLAANPARDLGPRLAHYLLPLPGKGSSEWHYGLVVPLWGPMFGAAMGAGIFKLMEAMYEMVEIVGEEANEL
ncbi:Glycerol uptake facilitator protein [Seminavis robusta]|uniref:Glycerol uptake facilitator protein n=1 Tax=Seminavis robusta TaxID=568900 RepID=A0A9N8EWT1_9STRA|nr:Glycerol uptake facilitator protein [Seminavis robusta]|eukprot:Sro1991_g309770.1 Glycerol uptake facilitator protein (511) ;mRNA; r:1961-3493